MSPLDQTISKKSTLSTGTESDCIQEDSNHRFGVFHEVPAENGPERWVIARIPKSWGTARSTRVAKPAPDGNRAEKPISIVVPFGSQDEALEVFRRWTNHSNI